MACHRLWIATHSLLLSCIQSNPRRHLNEKRDAIIVGFSRQAP